LLFRQVLKLHPQLSPRVDAQDEVLPNFGLSGKRQTALLTIERGAHCGDWRPEIANSISIWPLNVQISHWHVADFPFLKIGVEALGGFSHK
jgi:hypothetical protein